jgi:hypothetical protein
MDIYIYKLLPHVWLQINPFIRHSPVRRPTVHHLLVAKAQVGRMA